LISLTQEHSAPLFPPAAWNLYADVVEEGGGRPLIIAERHSAAWLAGGGLSSKPTLNAILDQMVRKDAAAAQKSLQVGLHYSFILFDFTPPHDQVET
jgi:hypothetical protein